MLIDKYRKAIYKQKSDEQIIITKLDKRSDKQDASRI